uniref:Uncharacterized protein n=1 Tax=Arundo donax TaxID=35708 RepID=A0A0A9E066_ARUDO
MHKLPSGWWQLASNSTSKFTTNMPAIRHT